MHKEKIHEISVADMSARKGKQDMKTGMEEMEGMVDSLIERHLS